MSPGFGLSEGLNSKVQIKIEMLGNQDLAGKGSKPKLQKDEARLSGGQSL